MGEAHPVQSNFLGKAWSRDPSIFPLQESHIDAGVIVVPSDRFQTFLPDRTPSFRDVVRYIEQEFKEAMTFPIIVIAVEHDDVGTALPKKRTHLGRIVE